MQRRGELPYDVDGAVLKVDDLRSRLLLGDSPSAPRWSVAWKFRAAEAATRLEGVCWQLGRSGNLVPVAELEPVSVGGVVVARASLHNAATLRRLRLRRGEMVVVRRAGDVVPQVVGAVRVLEGEEGEGGRDDADAAWLPPTVCPACGTPLVAVAVASSPSSPSIGDPSSSSSSRSPCADILRCPAANTCPGRALRRAQHFARAVVADGLERSGAGSGSAGGAGPAAVAAIVAAGLASDAADLVSLTPDIILQAKLPGFGLKRSTKVAAALSARGCSPGAVLAGLGVPGVGRAAADALLSCLGSLRAVAAAGASELELAPGIGPVTAASIEAWFAVDDNARMVERLLEKGVGAAEVERVPAPSSTTASATGKKSKKISASSSQPLLPLSGLSFVITGTVPNATRSRLKAAVKAAGGTAAAAVSSKTAAVVAGDAPGKSKVDAAAELGVEVIEASDFFDAEGRVVWRRREES